MALTDTPADSPLTLADVNESPFYRNLGTPELSPGDVAFDFELPYYEGGGRVRLSEFAGERPVALIFGSYT